MKRLLAILLTLILCYYTAGYYFVFKARQIQVKSEIKQVLKSTVPSEQLVVIRLSPENRHEFKWIHSREFRLKGNMYDVVKNVVVSPGVNDLYCINDREESILFENLDKWVKEAMNDGKTGQKAGKLLAGFFAGLFPPPADFIEIFAEIQLILYPDQPDLYLYLPIKIPTPPPRS